MDATAIIHATDEELFDIGVKIKGDILSLRSFAKTKAQAQQSTSDEKARDAKKKSLLDILKNKKGKAKPSLPSQRKIKLGSFILMQ